MAKAQESTPADRIRELSAINTDVAAMILAAGKAINCLTDRPLNSTLKGDASTTTAEATATMEDRKKAFAEETKAYYTTLQAVVARLRRQAYALEEAGIIAPEAPSLQSSLPQQNQQGPGIAERITNGGLGKLDVGWLNSRGNTVGSEKQSELMEESKTLLEQQFKSDGEEARTTCD